MEDNQIIQEVEANRQALAGIINVSVARKRGILCQVPR